MKPSKIPMSAPRTAVIYLCMSPAAATATTGIAAANTIWVLFSVTYRLRLRRACVPYQALCWLILSSAVELVTLPPYSAERRLAHLARARFSIGCGSPVCTRSGTPSLAMLLSARLRAALVRMRLSCSVSHWATSSTRNAAGRYHTARQNHRGLPLVCTCRRSAYSRFCNSHEDWIVKTVRSPL